MHGKIVYLKAVEIIELQKILSETNGAESITFENLKDKISKHYTDIIIKYKIPISQNNSCDNTVSSLKYLIDSHTKAIINSNDGNTARLVLMDIIKDSINKKGLFEFSLKDGI